MWRWNVFYMVFVIYPIGLKFSLSSMLWLVYCCNYTRSYIRVCVFAGMYRLLARIFPIDLRWSVLGENVTCILYPFSRLAIRAPGIVLRKYLSRSDDHASSHAPSVAVVCLRFVWRHAPKSPRNFPGVFLARAFLHPLSALRNNLFNNLGTPRRSPFRLPSRMVLHNQHGTPVSHYPNNFD